MDPWCPGIRGVESSERRVKARLLESACSPSILEDMIEWLWEEYGIRVSGGCERVKRAIVKSREVKARELAVFLLESGVGVDEIYEAWEG